MAVSTINKDGEDYASLTLWEDDVDGVLTEVQTAHVYDDDGDLSDSVAIDGSTTDVTKYMEVTAPAGERHAGTVASGAVVAVDDHWVICVESLDNYTRISWLIFDVGTYASIGLRNNDATNALFEKCIAYSSGTPHASSRGIVFENTGGGIAKNCICYNLGTDGIFFHTFTQCFVYNCTVYSCPNGISQDAGTDTHNVVNCAVFGNTDDFAGTMDIDFCASDDGDGDDPIDISPGGTEADDWAVAFTDYANGDFSVKDTNSVLYNSGTDLSGVGVADDVIGTSRPQATTYDVGSFELIAAAGVAPTGALYGPLVGPMGGPI